MSKFGWIDAYLLIIGAAGGTYATYPFLETPFSRKVFEARLADAVIGGYGALLVLVVVWFVLMFLGRIRRRQ